MLIEWLWKYEYIVNVAMLTCSANHFNRIYLIFWLHVLNFGEVHIFKTKMIETNWFQILKGDILYIFKETFYYLLDGGGASSDLLDPPPRLHACKNTKIYICNI